MEPIQTPIQISYEDIVEGYKVRMSELEYQLIFKEAESDAKTQKIFELDARIVELEAALEATKDNKGAKKNEKVITTTLKEYFLEKKWVLNLIRGR